MLAWDAAVSAAFFIQHSGMIRTAFRRSLVRAVPLHLHAAVYSVASGIVLVAVLVLWQRSSVPVWSVDPP